VRNPAQPPRSYAGNPPCDAACTQLRFAVHEQTHQRPVHVAEAEQAQVVGMIGSLQSAYPIVVVCSGLTLYITRTSPG